MKTKNKTRKISNLIGTLVLIIFLPILIINTVLIVKSYMYPDKVPDFLNYKPFIVLSGSMKPTIQVGDIVVTKICNPDNLKVNDIIAFREEKSVITHRIIGIEYENGEKIFLTKGDNNNVEDNFKIKSKDVEGIYITRIAKIGDLAMFLQTPIGAVIFISIPFVIFIVLDLINKKNDAKEQLEREQELQKEIEELKKQKEEITK